MLQPSTIKFLKDLKKNNNKEWFHANRKTYENAKGDYASFIDGIIKAHGKKDESIAGLTAKNCMFRINRDVRFSKDKSPYKTNFGASINFGGKKIMKAGYYIHCEPGAGFVAGGIYMPMPDDLKKLRQEIDYNFDEFKKIIHHKNFKSLFGDLSMDGGMKLSRPPKSYDETNPAIEYLKLKSFIATTKLSDADLSSKDLPKKILTAFDAIQQLVAFANRAIEE